MSEGLPDGLTAIDVTNILKKLSKTKTTILENLGITEDKWNEISKDVYGKVFTYCHEGEIRIIREIYPKIKDTEELARLVIFTKAMGSLYQEKGHD